ncbi:MAG: phospholipase D family protein [Caldilineaceae bacterium]|nr:phospholipase D family protein [Caldilineaceae bacterium]
MGSANNDLPDLFSEVQSTPHRLRTVRASFQESVPFDWSLLQGFDSLRVLTYTASLPTVVRILADGCKDLECIFGCERVLGGLRDVVALQHHVRCDIRTKVLALRGQEKPVIEAIVDGRARFYVVNGNVSHTKLYLLESTAGVEGIHRRVLVGSANLSAQALGGGQHEALILFENDDAAWQHFSSIYDDIRARSTDELPLREETWECEPDWRETPAVDPKTGTTHIVVEPTAPKVEVQAEREPHISEQIQILERVVEVLPDLDIEAPRPRNGRIHLPPAVKSKVRKVEVVRDPDQADHSSFRLDLNRRTAFLDDHPWTLDWDADTAALDARLLREYFAGFEEFSGQVKHLQRQYFILWAWYWFSPLLCDLRTRIQYVDGDLFQVPLFAVVFGASNCGKTSFVDTLATAMFGRQLAVDKDHFTRTKVRALQHNWGRLPIVFDDLSKRAFQDHGTNLIKNELPRPASEYPGLLLSMNADLTSYSDEIVKRCLMIHTTASLPQHREDRRQRLHAQVVKCRANLTTNLYRRWLSAVLDQLADDPLPNDWLLLATRTLAQMVAEGADPVPDWCRSMNWLTDYADHRHDQVRRRLRDHLRSTMYTPQDGTGEAGWTMLDSERLAVWESGDMFGRGNFSWDDVPSSLLDHDISGKRRTVLFRDQVEEFLGVPLEVPGQTDPPWWSRFRKRR